VSNRVIFWGFVLFGIVAAGALVYGAKGRFAGIEKYETIDRPARIYPDFSSTVIPPNIAPLDFMVQEKGSYYFAKIYSDKGTPVEISGKSPKILIPISRWHDLLDKNRGGVLHFDIFVKTDDAGWIKFAAITNKIARENVDDYLVYRRLHPTQPGTRGRIGIYQRNLKNFDEKTILDNRGNIISCVNCHVFCNNRPDKVLIGVRSNQQSPKTLLLSDGKIEKLNAKFGYTSWHPSGKLAVYSTDSLLPLFFHTVGNEVRDTFDANSALAYFVVDSKTVKTSPEISKKERMETWPAWSGDGRYLYFCTTPITWTIRSNQFPPDDYNKVKYDLVRVSYDVENDKWGQTEEVLSSKDTGLSIAMPKVSPDSRWLTFCMCEYGYFPTWQQSSDIYIVDLKAAEKTGRFEYHRLESNSDRSDSWHSWSSNSRWIVFDSKREHGVFTRSYLSYIDENGKAYKALVLPQKDPEFYDYCLETFNTPEFVTGPIVSIGERLARVVRRSDEVSVDVPFTGATATVVVPAREGGRVEYE
jgi:hypothetical protein